MLLKGFEEVRNYRFFTFLEQTQMRIKLAIFIIFYLLLV